jgi:hypothetical protein
MYGVIVMNLSYQEKSIWGSMVATLAVYGVYFGSGARGGLIGTIILLIIIQIVCQIAIAVVARPEPKDERDRTIERKAWRNGYVLLVTGTLVCMLAPTARSLLLALVVSEVVKSASQLYYYRRGV